jgi:outer membrane lipoprotein-sorting protein
MRRLVTVFAALLVCCAWTPSWAVTAQDVLKLMLGNYQAVRDYQADVTLTVKAPNISIKGMRMTLFYKQPGKTKVVAREGVGFMPKQMVFQATLQDMVRQSKLTYLGEETRNGVACYALKAQPKEQPKPAAPDMYPGKPGMPPGPPIERSRNPEETVKLWVDKKTGVIVGTSIDSAAAARYGVKVESNWKYQLVSNRYCMPTEISLAAQAPNISSPENMSLKVTFSNYRVNIGIPDAVFKEEPQPRPRSHRHGRPPMDRGGR